jgi:hypothetical protein
VAVLRGRGRAFGRGSDREARPPHRLPLVGGGSGRHRGAGRPHQRVPRRHRRPHRTLQLGVDLPAFGGPRGQRARLGGRDPLGGRRARTSQGLRQVARPRARRRRGGGARAHGGRARRGEVPS